MVSRKGRALHELARNDYEQRKSTPNAATASLSYRSLTRRTALIGLVGSLGAALVASPASAQSGTIPASTDPAFLKFRGDRLRLVKRSGEPSAPSSGRVTLYTDSGDL